MNKLIVGCLVLLITLPATANDLHSEKSLYRDIVVEEYGGVRCMVFGRHSIHPRSQSCVYQSKPEQLYFKYTKLVMAGLSLMPEPKSILILGLGGGTLPTSLERLYPESKIDTVEIDDAVVRVAKQWFAYRETPKQKVHVSDGRVFIKQQIRKKQHYDLVILDAFSGEYIPEHLMTREFLDEVRQVVNPDGLVIANTFSDNRLYHHESVTYQTIFGDFKYINARTDGNRVIFASPSKVSKGVNDKLESRVISHLTSIGVDFEDFKKQLTDKPDWQQDVRPLTDQFSPANLLNQ